MKKLIFIFLITFNLTAQVEFISTADKFLVETNERIRVDFTMNVDGADFKAPSFEGFKVLSGPTQEVKQTWVDEKKTFSKKYSYYIVAEKSGNVTIASASMKCKGNVYETQPLVIEVRKQANPKSYKVADSLQIVPKDGVFLVAEVSNSEIGIKDSVIVRYKLYWNAKIGISSWDDFTLIENKDFINVDRPLELYVEKAKYKGNDGMSIVVKEIVMHPKTAGTFEIAPLSIDLKLQIMTHKKDLFGRAQIFNDAYTVISAPQTIRVVQTIRE